MTEKDDREKDIEELRSRLEEAEETLRAIRSGEVDALVVEGAGGSQVYTLQGAESAYRRLVEAMNEGALVLTPDGSIMYGNHTFAQMLDVPLEQVIGAPIQQFVSDSHLKAVEDLLQAGKTTDARHEINLRKGVGEGTIPVVLSVGSLEVDGSDSISAVITDLTEQKTVGAELEKHREHLEDMVQQRTEQLATANEELEASNEELMVAADELSQANAKLDGEVIARKEAQEEAEHRAAELKSFLSSMADAVVLLDENGCVTFANRVATKMLGPMRTEEEKCRYLEGYGRVGLEGEPIPPQEWPSELALSGQTVRDMRYKLAAPWGKETVVSVSSAPVRDGDGHIVGATLILRDQSGRVTFEKEKQALLEREKRISDVLQRALIPHSAYSIAGLDLVVEYEAASKESAVGGDFYDVFELKDNKVGILIGDVAGKGLSAAISVAAIRHSIRSYAYLDPSPARVLSLANDAILKSEDTDVMITGLFAVLDMESKTLTYANGGHESPILVRADGVVEELESPGYALGVTNGHHYPEGRRELNEGDIIVMLTDGITESRKRAEDLFGMDGAMRTLAESAGKPLEVMSAELLQAARRFGGGTLKDDAAIVAFRLKEISQ